MRPTPIAFLAALVPVLAVHLAWWINAVGGGLPECNPYLTGCLSVSGAARSGPGLHVFRALVLPCAGLLALTWLFLRSWLLVAVPDCPQRARAVSLVGFIGALFLILYATWLGTDGAFYGWLRRQGVVFFFGLTGLAQMLSIALLWPRRAGLRVELRPLLTALLVIVVAQWCIGLASAFKDLYVPDPEWADALGNILEWGFLWTLTGAQALIGGLLMRSRFRFEVRVG